MIGCGSLQISYCRVNGVYTVHDKDYVRISAYARRMLLQLYAQVITGVRGSHYRCPRKSLQVSAEVITGVRGYQRVRVLLYVRVVLYMCTYVTLETTSRSST